MAPMSFRDEVGVEELARARIGPGVAGRDDAFALEGSEVVRSVVAMQNGSRFVAVAGPRDTARRTG